MEPAQDHVQWQALVFNGVKTSGSTTRELLRS